MLCRELKQIIKSLNERSMPKIEASGRHILKNRRMVAESPVRGLSSKKMSENLFLTVLRMRMITIMM